MKKIVSAAFAALLAAAPASAEKLKVRIAYPNAGALINGQIGHILEKTDILERNGLEGEVVAFPYWPPMQEALVAGSVDVAIASEANFVNIASKFPCKLIGTVGSAGRIAVMVREDSPAKKLADLKGKTVTVTFGTSAHYPVVKWILDAGLTPGEDIKVLHMAAAEGRAALAKGDIDAFTIWDPFVDDMVQKKTGRVLASKPSFLTTTIASDEFLKRDPEAAVRFLTALHEAVLFMAKNKALVNGWLSKSNGVAPELIDKGSVYNYNYSKARQPKDVRVVPGEDLFSLLENISEFNVSNKLQPAKAPVREKTDLTYVKAARERFLKSKFDPAAVKVK
ncbi:MAG: NrtA/SsuA/CpmA family ABC transporter substrate-binding protein [Elusimicrobiales bacterium]|nr:NrtA/SsuA/CpmA family ABC transporter substrate-binding protein [Elusimicrobiales bacterium]